MECCAKREKCLYMHSDFPCKYYYLGMKNHNKDNCKFSHGKPLTDQLRNILLKHLETAPKEILGDFPRINRENALSMLNIQHQKLLKEHGMNIPALPTGTQLSTSIKLPSLMDMVTKRQPLKKGGCAANKTNATHIENKIDSSNIKSDKPRKTRWCDVTALDLPHQQQQPHQIQNLQQQQRSLTHSNKLSNTHKSQTVTSSVGLQISGGMPASMGSLSYLSLRNLTGVITLEQINKLAEIGIENLDQINQLTVAQLNEFGLSITQIHEIQLNAMNIQKLGLATTSIQHTSTITPPVTHAKISAQTTSPPSSSNISTLIVPTQFSSTVENVTQHETDIPNSSFYMEFGSGGKDLDMRCAPNILQSTDSRR